MCPTRAMCSFLWVSAAARSVGFKSYKSFLKRNIYGLNTSQSYIYFFFLSQRNKSIGQVLKITLHNLLIFRHLLDGEMIKYLYRVGRKRKTHKKHNNHVYRLCNKLKTNKWFHWKFGQLHTSQLQLSEIKLTTVTEQP